MKGGDLMFNKEKTEYIMTPFKGEITDLKSVPDKVFSKKILGDGFAVIPADNILKAPCAGKIIQIFETGHALGIETVKGLEILIHIGINTVKLKGKGFSKLVQNGDQVKIGDPLIKIDLDFIKENSPSLSSPVIITNLEKVKNIEILAEGKVKSGSKVLQVKLL